MSTGAGAEAVRARSAAMHERGPRIATRVDAGVGHTDTGAPRRGGLRPAGGPSAAMAVFCMDFREARLWESGFLGWDLRWSVDLDLFGDGEVSGGVLSFVSAICVLVQILFLYLFVVWGSIINFDVS